MLWESAKIMVDKACRYIDLSNLLKYLKSILKI